MLVTVDPPVFWSERFLAEGCAITDPAAAPVAVDWWASDGYDLPEADRHTGQGSTLLIDDRGGAGTGGRGADLVVDHNLGVDAGSYPQASAVLLGPRYALLRRELCIPGADGEVLDRARRLVVVLGGAPSAEVQQLGQAVATDPRLGHLSVRVIGGGDDVPAALAAADLAFAAAGTVSWELCCRGVPAVLVAVAPNQEPVASHMALAGAADHVDAEAAAVVDALRALADDPVRREHMVSAGRALVDGLGARRVVCRLRADLLRCREASPDDAERIYRWSNDPATREASFSSAPISWDEHTAWLAARLRRTDAATYIALDASGHDVGLVRFDPRPQGLVEIGVTVAPERRRQGWGGALVDAGCRRWAAVRGEAIIEARIKSGNRGSVQSFLDADFAERSTDDPQVLRYARFLNGDARLA